MRSNKYTVWLTNVSKPIQLLADDLNVSDEGTLRIFLDGKLLLAAPPGGWQAAVSHAVDLG